MNIKILMINYNIEKVDSGLRSGYSVQTSLVINPIEKFGTEKLKNNVEFIKECYEFHNRLNPLEQFDVDSSQSTIFKKISVEQYNNIDFLQKIYTTFKPIFKDVLLPILKQKKTIFSENCSTDADFEKSLRHVLDKLELKNKLENDWHHVEQKDHKKQSKI